MGGESVEVGDRERFCLGLSWGVPGERDDFLPMRHGWSLGTLRITVAGKNLTAHRVGECERDALAWFVGPLLHWFADNWVELLHEGHFTWPERLEGGAAEVCNEAMSRFSGLGEFRKEHRFKAESWYRRHCLASAAEGGLFPDIFIRRFSDDIEVSWTGDAPAFAPDGFAFESAPGLARLAVDDVARPLSGLLAWASEHLPAATGDSFVEDQRALRGKIESLKGIADSRLNAAPLGEATMSKVSRRLRGDGRDDLLAPDVAEWPGARFAASEAAAAALFGGVSVELSDADVGTMCETLARSSDGRANERLGGYARNAPLIGKPLQDGYDLADEFLERLDEEKFGYAPEGFVDVRRICERLGVEIEERRLETDAVRGAALAGAGFAPRILVNAKSPYNRGDEGTRIAIGHELCHVLHDQGRSRRLAHMSGPWAAPGVEKRADAFAAWLLMPPGMLRRDVPGTFGEVKALARKLRVAHVALIEQLSNQDFVSDAQREEWMSAAISGPPS